MVEAMLQSPKFLFHVDGGRGGALRDYAIANRLSYFLWDTMPDRALLDAAANGELRTPDGIERVGRSHARGHARAARRSTNSSASGCASTACSARRRTTAGIRSSRRSSRR